MTRSAPIDPDALSLDAIRRGLLEDAPVTVLGFARSGIAPVIHGHAGPGVGQEPGERHAAARQPEHGHGSSGKRAER